MIRIIGTEGRIGKYYFQIMIVMYHCVYFMCSWLLLVDYITIPFMMEYMNLALHFEPNASPTLHEKPFWKYHEDLS